MTPPRAAPNVPRSQARSAPPRGAAVLFVILLAALSARPLVSETFIDTELGFLSHLDDLGVSGPRPSATAALDALLLIVSTIAFLLPFPGRRAAHFFVGSAVALITAIVLSCAFASDQRAALNAGGNIAATLIAATALYRLLHAPWMARLALAAMLASGGTLAMKCLLQVTGEFADTREFWQQDQRPQLENSGTDLTDPRIINYERRLASNEAMGFLSLSNLAASCLMMCLFPLVGLLIGSCATIPPARAAPADAWAVRAVLAVLTAALLAALWFTGSTGALAATVGGAAALALLGIAGAALSRRALLFTMIGAVAYFSLIAAAGLYGASKGTLPHPSLAFRWHYWSTAPAALHDGWPIGLGRENFQSAYLRHKPPESPEETRDPHNLALTLLLELGPLGLAAGLALLGWLIWHALRGLSPPALPAESHAPEAEAAHRIPASIAGLAVTFLVIHGCLSASFFGRAQFVGWLIQVAAVWLLCFAVLCGLLRPGTYGPLDTRWLRAGLAAGLIAALVHGLVDFALLTPAGLAIFAWLAFLIAHHSGAANAHTAESGRPADFSAPFPTRPSALLPTALMVCIGVHLAFVAVPNISAENARAALYQRLMESRSFTDAEAALARGERSLNADRFSDAFPRALATAARQLARTPDLPADRQTAWLQRARTWVEEAQRRNPDALAPRRDLARLDTDLAESFAARNIETEEAAALLSAAQSFDAAVTAYPTDPRLRIDAGVAWYESWRLSRDAAHARRAVEHLQAALAIDARRPPEEVMRLRIPERETIADHLTWLAAALQPASHPSTAEE